MPKIYVICVDAYPETDELKKLLTSKGLSRSDLVCAGAFTCATITSMISGTIGSEIIPGGIGYNTIYKPDFTSWRRSRSLVENLLQANKQVIVHNHVPWFSKVFCGKVLSDEEKTKHYRDHVVDNTNVDVKPFCVIKTDDKIEYSSTNPESTLNTFVKWNFPDLKAKFYNNETQYIRYVQKKQFDGLFFTDLCHWHEYCYYPNGQVAGDKLTKTDALNNSIDWLRNWNFSEPNSIFFVFADHSHRVKSYIDPPGNVTWAYYIDNINKTKLHPVISSNDFYHLANHVFGTKPTISVHSVNPITKYNPNRIYACEDGRANSADKTVANAYSRSCLINTLYLSVTKLTDSVNNPAGIYVILANITNKNTYSVYRFALDIIDKSASVVEKFSIKCPDAVSSTIRTDEMIFELTDSIMAKAIELYKLIV